MTETKASGRAFKFADNVDTDAIIAARYLNVSDFAALAAHCMEDIDDGFAKAVADGDYIIAGENFARARARGNQGVRRARGNRQELCAHILPQRNQYRVGNRRVRGGGGRRGGRRRVRGEFDRGRRRKRHQAQNVFRASLPRGNQAHYRPRRAFGIARRAIEKNK